MRLLLNAAFPFFVASGLFAVAIQFYCALAVFPLPLTDALVFIPTAVSFEAGNGLINPLFDYLYMGYLNEDGVPRFISHAPVFPWLTGALMPFSGPKGAFVVLALFKAITLSLFAFLVWLNAKSVSNSNTKGYSYFVGGLGLLGVGVMFLPTVGRPEILLQLCLLVAYLWLVFVGNRIWRLVGLGILLGLVGSIHPAGAILGGLSLAVVYLLKERFSVAFVDLFGIAALGSALCLLILLASPNGLNATVHGLTTTGGTVSGWSTDDEWLVLRYWFLWWDRPFFGAVCVYLLPVALSGLWLRRRNIPLLGTAVVIAVAVWFFGIKNSPASYNIAAFYPVLCLLGMAFLCRGLGGNWTARTAFAVVLALPSLAYLKSGSEMIAKHESGTFFQRASEYLNEHLEGDHRLYFSRNLWVLLEPDWYDRSLELFLDNRHDIQDGSYLLVWRNQDLSQLESARGVLDLVVVADFVDIRPSVLGFPTSSGGAGFGFTLYQIVANESAGRLAREQDIEMLTASFRQNP